MGGTQLEQCRGEGKLMPGAQLVGGRQDAQVEVVGGCQDAQVEVAGGRQGWSQVNQSSQSSQSVTVP